MLAGSCIVALCLFTLGWSPELGKAIFKDEALVSSGRFQKRVCF